MAVSVAVCSQPTRKSCQRQGMTITCPSSSQNDMGWHGSVPSAESARAVRAVRAATNSSGVYGRIMPASSARYLSKPRPQVLYGPIH
jgi:hypothetical protein